MIKPVSFKAYFVNNENLRELYYRNSKPKAFNVGYFKKSCPNHKLEVISVSAPDADESRYVNIYNHATDKFLSVMTDYNQELDSVLQILNVKHIRKDDFGSQKHKEKTS